MRFFKNFAFVIICTLMATFMFNQPVQAKWPDQDSVYKHVVYKEIHNTNFGTNYRFIIKTDTGYTEEFFYVTDNYNLESCDPIPAVALKKVYVKECPYLPCSIIDSIPQYKAVYVLSRIRMGNPSILWFKIRLSIDDNVSIKGFVEAKEFKNIFASSDFYAWPSYLNMVDTLYITQKTSLKSQPFEDEEGSIKLKTSDIFKLLGEDESWLLILINGNIGWVRQDETSYDGCYNYENVM